MRTQFLKKVISPVRQRPNGSIRWLSHLHRASIPFAFKPNPKVGVPVAALGAVNGGGGYPECIDLMDPTAIPPEIHREAIFSSLRRREIIHKTADGYRLASTNEFLPPGGVIKRFGQTVRDGLFIRQEKFPHVPPDFLPFETVDLPQPLVIERPVEKIPSQLPDGWQEDLSVPAQPGHRRFLVSKVAIPTAMDLDVSFGARVPQSIALKHASDKGFALPTQYVLYAGQQALDDLGIPFESLIKRIPNPNERISVYVSSAFGDYGPLGAGAYIRNWLTGKRVTSLRPLANSEPDFPAGNLASYLLGPYGLQGRFYTVHGACATFGSTLDLAAYEIISGRADMVFMATTDCVMYPWLVEAFTDRGVFTNKKLFAWADELRKENKELHDRWLGENREHIFRFTSAPFSTRTERFGGLTPGDGATALILMSPRLMLETGADPRCLIYGTAVSSDGLKDSPTEPGTGIRYALEGIIKKVLKALPPARGREILSERAFGAFHGTGTTDCETAESQSWHEAFDTLGLRHMVVSAPKSTFGHNMANSGAINALFGVRGMELGVVPKILNLAELGIRKSVRCDAIEPLFQSLIRDPEWFHFAFSSEMGFGGHNAAVAVLSSALAQKYLAWIGGRTAYAQYLEKADHTRRVRAENREAWMRGKPVHAPAVKDAK